MTNLYEILNFEIVHYSLHLDLWFIIFLSQKHDEFRIEF
jgi:hypothetical protein